MEIEKHIKNLEEYCEVDNLFEKDGDFKEFCDNHIADIKAIIQELKNTQSDLYEANKRIADLLLILGDRDRMINKMAEFLIGFPVFNYNGELETTLKDKEDVIKYFEERCKDAKD